MSPELNAELDGSIDLNGGVTGTLDSGEIKLVEVAIPGLNFPGYVSFSNVRPRADRECVQHTHRWSLLPNQCSS